MRASRIDGVKVVEVIEVDFIRGEGINDRDPVRRVMAWYDMNGVLLGEHDDWADEQKAEKEDDA
jgi:hypothetical protein